MPKVKAECFNCDSEYLIHESDANTPSMYCSAKCENTDELRLKDENKSIDAELTENPTAFARTVSPLQTLATELAKAQASTEAKSVFNVVDSMFDRLNQKSKNKD